MWTLLISQPVPLSAIFVVDFMSSFLFSRGWTTNHFDHRSFVGDDKLRQGKVLYRREFLLK